MNSSIFLILTIVCCGFSSCQAASGSLVGGLLGSVTDLLTGTLSTVIQLGGQICGKLSIKVTAILPSITAVVALDGVLGIVSNLVANLLGTVVNLLNSVLNLAGSLLTLAADVASSLLVFLKAFLTCMIHPLVELLEVILCAASDLVDDVLTNLTKTIGSLKVDIMELLNNLLGCIDDSPVTSSNKKRSSHRAIAAKRHRKHQKAISN